MKANQIASVFPSKLAKPWLAGYVHYHTAFGFPAQHRVSPEELRREVAELGGDFVFCAGDHDCQVDGVLCPDWYEGKDYYELALAANEDNGVVLLPSGEYHLWFPELIARDYSTGFWPVRRKHPDYQPFHHALIPMIDWTDAVCRHVRENTSSALVETAELLGIAVTLNHPGLCHLSGHPDPLNIPWLKKMPYIEMFNTMEHFAYDWAIYKHYLTRPESSRMGVFAGVDFCSHRGFGLSTAGNERAEHVTYIHAPDGRSVASLYGAWSQRRTVAVRGRMFLEHIRPVILRNGRSVHCQYLPGQEVVEMCWRDETFEGSQARYTVVVEAEGDWLITSPIGFQKK